MNPILTPLQKNSITRFGDAFWCIGRLILSSC